MRELLSREGQSSRMHHTMCTRGPGLSTGPSTGLPFSGAGGKRLIGMPRGTRADPGARGGSVLAIASTPERVVGQTWSRRWDAKLYCFEDEESDLIDSAVANCGPSAAVHPVLWTTSVIPRTGGASGHLAWTMTGVVSVSPTNTCTCSIMIVPIDWQRSRQNRDMLSNPHLCGRRPLQVVDVIASIGCQRC